MHKDIKVLQDLEIAQATVFDTDLYQWLLRSLSLPNPQIIQTSQRQDMVTLTLSDFSKIKFELIQVIDVRFC